MLSLLESFLVDGYWRLPRSRREIAGTVSYAPEDGITLRLNGSFQQLGSKPPTDDVIYGMTIDGKRVTLLRCIRVRDRQHIPGYPVAEYRATLMLIGPRHFRTYNAVRFISLDIAVHNAEECIGLSGIVVQHPGAQREGLSAAIAYQRPRQLTLVADDIRITISHEANVTGDEIQSSGISQRAWIGMKAPGRKRPHLDAFLDGPARSIQSLLELIAQTRLPLVAARGLVDTARRLVKNRPRQLHTDVVFHQVRPLPIPRRRRPIEMLFTLDELGPHLGDCFRRWHAGRERYGPTFDLSFSVSRHPEMPLEHRFLFLIQALESYHRRSGRNEIASEKEHSARLGRIIASAPASDTDWLRDKLRFANEPSLGRRIKDLYEDLPISASRTLFGAKQRFAADIANTRNYLTHFSPELKSRALLGTDLWRDIIRLQLMLKSIFLKELQIPSGCRVDITDEERLLQQR